MLYIFLLRLLLLIIIFESLSVLMIYVAAVCFLCYVVFHLCNYDYLSILLLVDVGSVSGLRLLKRRCCG